MNAELKKTARINYNQLKIKFEKLEEFEKQKLNHINAKLQSRIILFDLSFIFRFLFGRTIRNDTFEEVFDKKNVLFHTLEIMNLFAHYKKFFYSRSKASTYFYLYKSKKCDSESEKMIVDNIIKLSDYFHCFNYAGNPSNIDDTMDSLKVINGTGILKKYAETNSLINTIVYNFTSSDVFTAYLYEITEIGLDNPFIVVHYHSGEVYIDTFEDYIGGGKYKPLFEIYEKNRLTARNLNIITPKPKIIIPLLDREYSRITFTRDNENNNVYSGKSLEKINDLIERYKTGNNKLDDIRVNNFYKDLISDSIDNEIHHSTIKRWGKKLFDKKIYDLQDLSDDLVKIEWILNNEQ